MCTHHLSRPALANQNGRPDLSKRPGLVESARIGRSAPHFSERDETNTSSPANTANDTDVPGDSVTVTPVTTNEADPSENTKEMDESGDTAEKPRSSSPPNPFDESDEEEEEEDEGVKEEETQTPDKHKANGDITSTPVSHQEGVGRPVPAPRRVSEHAAPPRPSPRVRLPRTADGLTVGTCSSQNGNDCEGESGICLIDILPHILSEFTAEHQKPPTPPKPRERSQSPGR